MLKRKQTKYEREAHRSAKTYAAQFAAEMVDADIAAGNIPVSQRDTEIAYEELLLKRTLLSEFLKEGVEKQAIRVRLQSTLSQRCGDAALAENLVRKIDFAQLDEKQLTAVLVNVLQIPSLGRGESDANIRADWDEFVAPYHDILQQRIVAAQAKASEEARLRTEEVQRREALEAQVQALEAQLAAQQAASPHFFSAASAGRPMDTVSGELGGAPVAAEGVKPHESSLKKARRSSGD